MQKILLPAAAALAVAASLAAGAVQAKPVRYETDPSHTFVTFEVKHFSTSTVRARFDTVDGALTLDREARKGKADIVIDMASVSSGVPDFDKHLKTADFFDVAKYPQARFVSEDFRFEGDKLTAVTGKLTMLGKTIPVTLRGTSFNCYDQPVLKAPVCGGDFETTIKRSQWGMNWGISMGVPDDVRLLVQIEAVRK